jgi:hypothetical protein
VSHFEVPLRIKAFVTVAIGFKARLARAEKTGSGQAEEIRTLLEDAAGFFYRALGLKIRAQVQLTAFTAHFDDSSVGCNVHTMD